MVWPKFQICVAQNPTLPLLNPNSLWLWYVPPQRTCRSTSHRHPRPKVPQKPPDGSADRGTESPQPKQQRCDQCCEQRGEATNVFKAYLVCCDMSMETWVRHGSYPPSQNNEGQPCRGRLPRFFLLCIQSRSIQLRSCIYVCFFFPNMYVYKYIYIHTYIYICIYIPIYIHWYIYNIYIYLYIYIYIGIYIYNIYTYIYIHSYIYIYTQYIYIYLYVHIHIYIYTFISYLYACVDTVDIWLYK